MAIRNLVAGAGLALLVSSCSCSREADPPTQPNTAMRDDAAPAAPVVAQPSSPAMPEAAQHDGANALLQAAGDVVQRYLATVGSGDWQKADALWGYRRGPAHGDEGGLRALMPPRSMRIDTSAPRALDQEPSPGYAEVPVRLRIDDQAGVQHRYVGWYRLGRNAVEQRWELTAASVSAEMR